LYAIKEINFHLGADGRNLVTVLGYISLVIWSLIVIITFKYIVLVLRADNEGEGGVFALLALIKGFKGKGIAVATVLLLMSFGFLLGDGIVTPAISVISAIEGLGIVTSAFEPYIVAITVAILLGLFMIQKKGTAKIGIWFGPIIAVWFLCLTWLGLRQIVGHPEVLLAFNPLYAIQFLLAHDGHTIALVLGSVILVVTGGEALYADVGHFGKAPIRISWFALTFPALVLNYLGQGAFLLGDQPLINHNVFFSMVPSWGLIPMVALATLAAIIASQALITGAFSLFAQGIALGYIPYLKVIHTHKAHFGQIYVPLVNTLLLVGCVTLVLVFRSSTHLASAYGLAVAYVMLVTTMAVFFIARYLWRWSELKAWLVFLPLGLIDLAFLITNSLKFIEGGYIPLGVGVVFLIIMQIWYWGKRTSYRQYQKYSSTTIRRLIEIKKKASQQIPKSFIIMTPFGPQVPEHKVPLLCDVLLDRYGMMPHHVVFMTVINHQIPYYKADRFSIYRFYDDRTRGSIIAVRINYGFMEKRDVELALQQLSQREDIQIDRDQNNWLVHVTRKKLFVAPRTHWLIRLGVRFYQLMYQNAKSADEYLDLGKETKLSIEVLPVQIK
jgi:KUP system potassium uptake protein